MGPSCQLFDSLTSEWLYIYKFSSVVLWCGSNDYTPERCSNIWDVHIEFWQTSDNCTGTNQSSASRQGYDIYKCDKFAFHLHLCALSTVAYVTWETIKRRTPQPKCHHQNRKFDPLLPKCCLSPSIKPRNLNQNHHQCLCWWGRNHHRWLSSSPSLNNVVFASHTPTHSKSSSDFWAHRPLR